jgi:hypothetical protein
MWVELKRVQGRIAAEMWKALYEGGGLPTRLMPERIELWDDEFAEFKICVPRAREHVAEEIERKV